MDFHSGGDLLSLLNRRDLTEEDARFYLAEIIEALHALHSMGYVHRDIKPENVLLDRLGHVKLADFGSSAKLDSTGFVRNQMAVGTTNYISPEVLNSINSLPAGGYGVECDYWSLGILAYEMVFGSTPFGSDKMSTTYANIMNFKNSFQWPNSDTISVELRSLISGLVCDRQTRLGYQKLLLHPFFATIDWNSLREKSPPYVPFVTGLDDTSNFEDFEKKGIVSHSTVNFKNGKEENNLPFIGFTFVKENNLICQVDGLPSTVEFQQRIMDLESELNTKMREMSDLRKEKLQYEEEISHVDLYKQKVNRLEGERDTLEKKLVHAQREAETQRQKLQTQMSERSNYEAKVVEMVREMKRNCEKMCEKEKNELMNELRVISVNKLKFRCS